SNGQTIAGALSTGTHGGAIQFGAIPEYEVGIHLAIEPEGKTVWLERASHPVLKDEVVAALGAVPLRDDAVFNAALVSFGCFGIILGVVIEPASSYFLHGSRAVYKLSDAHWSAIQNLDFAAAELPLAKGRTPYHLELLCNVLDHDRSLVTALYRETQRPQADPVTVEGPVGKGDAALDVIGAITDSWTGSAELFSKLLSRAYKPYENVAGTPPEFFRDTSTRGRSAATGVGVPISRAREVFEIACKALRDNQAPALVSMRFVKSTQATFGFTMHPPVTAVTELDGAFSTSTRAAQQAFWKAVRNAGIPHSFHWGKLNDLNAANLRLAYGAQRVDEWIAARRQLIRPELRRIFSNPFAESLGVID
ncbi:MAG: FAD-binding protein, partial [Longimicrobiaceae bacterium]